MNKYWYKNAVIYSLDVESYLDLNGDGVGDFQGLKHALRYLSGLGINCLWLLPFYPSPNRDNGYDITDYYDIDHRLGNLGDFAEFDGEFEFVPDRVKEAWLELIEEEGAELGRADASISLLALSQGAFGFQLSTLTFGGAELNPDASELMLFGNVGRTGTASAATSVCSTAWPTIEA